MKKLFFVIVLILALCSTVFAGVNSSIDANRDTLSMLATFTSTSTVETSVSFQVSANGGTLSTAATSYTVTTGKTLKVQTIAAACRGGGSSPAASTATLKIKVNGVQQGQNYQVACPTTATASATNFPSLPIWMDLDIRSASAITFTLTLSNWSSSVNTPILDLSVFAYEF